MSHLQPVPSDYRPQYPRELTRQEIEELLRPHLLKRFSQHTLAAGAMITGMTAAGCGPPAPTAAVNITRPTEKSIPQPRKGPTTSTDPNLKKKVDTIVAEVLGKKKGSWYENSYLGLKKELKHNPPVKYPIIPISYGNSCVGIFDHATAREATYRLFKAYGISLKKNVPVKGDGYQFAADGFDAEGKIGFELVLPQGGFGLSGKKYPKETPADRLSDDEKTALGKDVKAGAVNVLVIDAAKFPNMDGDLYTPMEYYLGTVVDYLNWVHGGKIDTSSVLGKLPGRTKIQHEQIKAWQAKYPTLPSCGFESEDDLKHWTIAGGELAQSTVISGNVVRWRRLKSSSNGSKSLQIQFKKGGKAVYTVPDGQSVRLKPKAVAFACRTFCGDEQPAPLRIVLVGKDGATWEINQSVKYMTDIIDERETAPFKELKSIEISLKDGSARQILLDDLGLSRE